MCTCNEDIPDILLCEDDQETVVIRVSASAVACCHVIIQSMRSAVYLHWGSCFVYHAGFELSQLSYSGSSVDTGFKSHPGLLFLLTTLGVYICLALL